MCSTNLSFSVEQNYLCGNKSLHVFDQLFIAVQTFIAVHIFLFHAKTKIGRIRADFYCRTDFLCYTKTKICRTHPPRADVYCRTDGTDIFSGVYELETRFARII